MGLYIIYDTEHKVGYAGQGDKDRMLSHVSNVKGKSGGDRMFFLKDSKSIPAHCDFVLFEMPKYILDAFNNNSNWTYKGKTEDIQEVLLITTLNYLSTYSGYRDYSYYNKLVGGQGSFEMTYNNGSEKLKVIRWTPQTRWQRIFFPETAIEFKEAALNAIYSGLKKQIIMAYLEMDPYSITKEKIKNKVIKVLQNYTSKQMEEINRTYFDFDGAIKLENIIDINQLAEQLATKLNLRGKFARKIRDSKFNKKLKAMDFKDEIPKLIIKVVRETMKSINFKINLPGNIKVKGKKIEDSNDWRYMLINFVKTTLKNGERTLKKDVFEKVLNSFGEANKKIVTKEKHPSLLVSVSSPVELGLAAGLLDADWPTTFWRLYNAWTIKETDFGPLIKEKNTDDSSINEKEIIFKRRNTKEGHSFIGGVELEGFVRHEYGFNKNIDFMWNEADKNKW